MHMLESTNTQLTGGLVLLRICDTSVEVLKEDKQVPNLKYAGGYGNNPAPDMLLNLSKSQSYTVSNP